MDNSILIDKKLTEDYWFSKYLKAQKNNTKAFKYSNKVRTSHEWKLSFDASNSVEEIANGNVRAKYVLLLANLCLLLNRYFDNQSVIVESTCWKSDFGDQGLNPIMFDIQYDGEYLLTQFLNEVKKEISNSYQYGHYNKGEIHEILKNNGIETDKLLSFHFGFSDINMNDGFQTADFFLNVIRSDNEWRVELTYDKQLFPHLVAEVFLQEYEYLLKEIKFNLKRKLGAINVLPDLEYQKLIYDYNNVSYSRPPGTIVEVFEKQVFLNPEKTALINGKANLSYGKLNVEANKVASYLRSACDIRQGCKVGVMLHSSEWLVISILGVLKSGAAFIPINATNPQTKIDFIIGDSGIEVLVTQIECLSSIQGFKGRVFAIDAELENLIDPEINESQKINEESDAYIIYTSGSTGTPKGVVVQHKSLMNYIDWASRKYVENFEDACFPLFTSIAFDLTFTSLFVPLASGKSIVIYSGKNAGLMLDKILSDNLVDIIKLTPSHLRLIRHKKHSNTRIKTFIVGGEMLESDLARDIYLSFGKKVIIYNEYGPTEAVIGCMIHKYNPMERLSKSVPIGIPSDNNQIYILDSKLNPVPTGVVGDLFISGQSLSKGYLNNAELTAGKFVKNPFVAGQVMYKSGDKARMLSNLTAEYIGRADDQIKHNGYRIEPVEIVSEIIKYEGIVQCHIEYLKFKKNEQSDVIHCVKCGMPSNYPNIEFNDSLICDSCLSFEVYKEKAQKYFKTLVELKEIFNRNKAIKESEYDCLMLLSGGKDSTYVLYQLVREMGLKVLVFSFDNGFISEEAKANINHIVKDLGCDLIMSTSPYINEIFVESLKKFNNVCNGCYKTIYSLSIKLALEKKIRYIVTGLSRGQLFETRLDELYRNDIFDVKTIEKSILNSRLSYHRMDDTVSRKICGDIFSDDQIFEKVQFLDFYRYCDVQLEDLLEYIDRNSAWVRPSDTGRSTNCLINDLGIHIHKKKLGFHNYALPYAWDVRMGHKNRDSALEELDDNINVGNVDKIMKEIGYTDESAVNEDENKLVAYLVAKSEINIIRLKKYLSQRLPDYMIPNEFVQLTELPLTSNGKINKKDLPVPGQRRINDSIVPYVAPVTDEERKLVGIWEDVLGKKNIGVNDNFFDLNGHSLKAVVMVAKVHQVFKKEILLKDVFDSPILNDLLKVIKELKTFNHRQIDHAAVKENYTLSSSQKRMWVLSQFEEANRAYNVVAAFKLIGVLREDLLEKAFRKLILRHEILRTVFVENENNEIRQRILEAENCGFSVRRHDLRTYPEEIKIVEQKRLIKASNSAFDLSKGSLIRVEILRLKDEEYVLAAAMHHIISDEWSIEIIMDELFVLYNSDGTQENEYLEPLKIQYKDYAEWEQSELLSGKFNDDKNYWVNQLGVEIPVLNFPIDKVRPPVRTYNGAIVKATLDRVMTTSLNKLCQQSGCTLYMGVLALVNILIYKYTGEDDIILGSPVTVRDHVDLKNQCGLYLNSIPLRTRFRGEDTFAGLLEIVKEVAVNGYDHILFPFDNLVSELNLERSLNRNMLFDISVILQAKDNLDAKSLGNLSVSKVDLERNVSLFDLTFYFKEEDDGLGIAIEYNTDIFNKTTIEKMSSFLNRITEFIINNSSIKIDEIDYLSEDEIGQLTLINDAVESDELIGVSVIDLFNIQLSKTPEKIALNFDGSKISYLDLDRKSNEFTEYLKSNRAVSKNEVVAIILERSEWLVIVLLGVIRAGATCLLIDEDSTDEMIELILNKTNCSKVIRDSDLKEYINSQKFFAKYNNFHNEQSEVAFVYYYIDDAGNLVTINIDQNTFLNTVMCLTKYLKIDDKDNSLQFNGLSSLAFLYEIIPAIISGGTLHIINEAYKFNPVIFRDFVMEYNITCVLLPINCIHMLKAVKNELIEKLLVIGNLDNRMQLVKDTPKNKYYNLYSPYGSGIIAAIQEVVIGDYFDKEERSIGRPVTNTGFYILDSNKKLVPAGAVGDIYLVYKGLTSSYFDVNKSGRVCINPFNKEAFIFRTGDRGRLISHNKVEYFGRTDNKIERDGKCIDLYIIENALKSYSGIEKCIVLSVYSEELHKSILIAYYKHKEAMESDVFKLAIANYLNDKLPNHMIPEYYFRVNDFYLADDKSNRKYLEKKYLNSVPGVKRDQPLHDDGDKLVSIWSSILGIKEEKLNRLDNYFELGGNSLSLTRLKTGIQKMFNVKIELKDLFLNPTLERQFEIINRNRIVEKTNADSVYFIPPLFGNPMVYKSIMEKIGEKYNTYGLQYLGIEEGEEYFSSIQDAAQYFCEIIFGKENKGKIILFGYSLGGNIAFEMMKILEQKFSNTALVLVDATGGIMNSSSRSVSYLIDKIKDFIDRRRAKSRIRKLDVPQFKGSRQLVRFVANSLKMQDNYSQTGVIRSDIYAVKTEAVCLEIEVWKKYTSGNVSLESIGGGHWTALRRINDSVYINLIDKITKVG